MAGRDRISSRTSLGAVRTLKDLIGEKEETESGDRSPYYKLDDRRIKGRAGPEAKAHLIASQISFFRSNFKSRLLIYIPE